MPDTIRLPIGENSAASAFPQRSADDEDLTPLGRDLTAAEARHFLSRTSFGSTDLAVAELTALGLARYLDRMLDVNRFPGVAAVESQAESLNSDPDYPENQHSVWTSIMVNTPNPFQEVLALFWNGHFGATFNATETANRYFTSEYMRLLRTKGTESFKELVAEVSTSNLMLLFLNGLDSTREAPNENFARELWELFTLGRDNGYTQADIVQAARALTGFKRRPRADVDSLMFVEYDPARHDPGDKQIFARTLKGRDGEDGVREYRDIVELTFSARDPAPLVARKLWEYFVYLEPSETLVAALGARLRAHDWDLTAFLRTVFSSRAFFSPAASVGIVKSPVEYMVGFLRLTRLQLPINVLTEMLKQMGQLPGYPPAVNGWPSGKLWLSSAQLVQRAGAVGTALATAPAHGFDHLLPPLEKRGKAEVVAALADHMNVSVEPEEHRLYEESLDIGTEESGYSNLMYMLAQHPSYHLR